jgi:hypothetical protein
MNEGPDFVIPCKGVKGDYFKEDKVGVSNIYLKVFRFLSSTDHIYWNFLRI